MKIDAITLKETEDRLEQEFENYLLGRADRLQLRSAYESRLDILNEWFDIFLDKVDLDPSILETPEWDLYNLRYKEWELFDEAINRLNIYTT